MTGHKAEPMRGRIIESDFGKDTVTFRMEPPYYVTGGEFLIAPIGGGISLDSLTAAPAASEATINSDGIDSKLIDAASDGEDVRLWDSQWVNVVNHANCYEDFTKEEAVAHAVKMTEQYMRANITAGFPHTRPAAQVAATQPAARRVTDEDVERACGAAAIAAGEDGWPGGRAKSEIADCRTYMRAALESFAQPAEGVSVLITYEPRATGSTP